MDALQLLTWSLILYLFASLASLFLLGLDRLAIKLSGITSLVGGVIGIISGITQLHAGVTLVAHFATPFDFADLTLRMDSLSAFMVLVISLLVVVCSLYSLTYMREYEGKGAAAMGFFMNLFIASMVALLVMDNAFWFIVLFEMMSLSSWFLVIARQDKTSINAGMLYFFIAHAGSVLIMIAFLLMGRESGSLNFASFARFHFLRGWRRRCFCWPGVPSKTSALFCWQSVWRWSVCHCTTRCSPWLDCSAHCFICSTMRCSKAAISRRGRDYFAFAYPRHGKNGGTGETDAVDSRSMPDWLPRDISHSSAEWFYQRMVHLAVAVLTKSCGSRSATTCGSYCYGNAGSHWWAGSNVLRKNVRYYFLWCAAQYTR